MSAAEKQERAAWLSEADVEFFTGGGPAGQPSSEEQPIDPEMQSTVQVDSSGRPCCCLSDLTECTCP